MKPVKWSPEKNEWLKENRKISFEEIEEVLCLEGSLDTIDSPNKLKYPNQKSFVVKVENYIYLVPFVEDEEEIFLKTIYASRKMTKKYLKKG